MLKQDFVINTLYNGMESWWVANKENKMSKTEAEKAYNRQYMANNSRNTVTKEHFTEEKSNLFWAKVEKTDTCWNWTGAKTAARPQRPQAPATEGYGVFNINKRPFYAHRLSYLVHKGPLVDGLVIDHICNNSLCVNPDHLEQVTNRENTLRSPRHSVNAGSYNKGGRPKKSEQGEKMVNYNKMIDSNLKKQENAEERIAIELDYIKEMIDDGTVDTNTNS